MKLCWIQLKLKKISLEIYLSKLNRYKIRGAGQRLYGIPTEKMLKENLETSVGIKYVWQ